MFSDFNDFFPSRVSNERRIVNSNNSSNIQNVFRHNSSSNTSNQSYGNFYGGNSINSTNSRSSANNNDYHRSNSYNRQPRQSNILVRSSEASSGSNFIDNIFNSLGMSNNK